MKKLLLVAALLLPAAAMARAEDNVIRSTRRPDSAAPFADYAKGHAPVGAAPTSSAYRASPRSTRRAAANTASSIRRRSCLQKGEVVITFDDGPHPVYTREILDALAAQCTKATFFNVGEMIKNFPDVARQVQAEGHTVGTHTYTHRNLGGPSLDRAEQQIESTINIAEATLPNGVAPFFRFPYLCDPKRVRDYLAKRNIAVFGIDVDSFDWRVRTPEKVDAQCVYDARQDGRRHHPVPRHPRQHGKGDPAVLAELKARGYKVVHVVPKSRIETVAMAEPAAAAPRRRAHRHRRIRQALRSARAFSAHASRSRGRSPEVFQRAEGARAPKRCDLL